MLNEQVREWNSEWIPIPLSLLCPNHTIQANQGSKPFFSVDIYNS